MKKITQTILPPTRTGLISREDWGGVRVVNAGYEGVNYHRLASLIPRIKSLGFERIVTHVGFCGKSDFKPNSIYIKCQFDRRESRPKSAIRTVDVPWSDGSPILLEQSQRHRSIPKDIEFLCKGETFKGEFNANIGWYNRKLNVLWLSDITHYSNQAYKHLKFVLKHLR